MAERSEVGGIVLFKHNKNTVAKAKALRREMTREERHLWYDFLRDYPLKFTRQKVIGPYIVDFYCPKADLVVELDGSQHFTEEGLQKDAERTAFLQQFHLTILRFPNNEVNNHFEEVCTVIHRHVQQSLSQLR